LTASLSGVKVARDMLPSLGQKLSVWGIHARIAVGQWAQSFLRPGSAVVALIAAAYGICQLLKQESLPYKTAWTRAHPYGWLLLTTGVVALIGTVLVFAGYSRVLRKTEQKEDLDDPPWVCWRLC
jgi:hypothetical protein